MGTIREKLAYLNNTKALIRNAIIDKGVAVASSDTFRSYAEKIGLIEGGSGTSSSSLNLGPYVEPTWNYTFANNTEDYPEMDTTLPTQTEYVWPEDWWDIEAILDADTEDYPAKMIVLYPNNTATSTLYGANFYRVSDGTTYTAESQTTSYTHTWDQTFDKVNSNGVGYRYVISYFSSATGINYLQSRYQTMNTNAIAVVTKGFRWQNLTDNTSSSSYYTYRPFYDRDRLQYIKTKDSDWSDIWNLSYFCAESRSLEYAEFDFNNGNSLLEGVTNTYCMFYNCTALKRINFSMPRLIETCNQMFYNCYNLTSINLDFTYKDEGRVCSNMNSMFEGSGVTTAIITHDPERDTIANPWIMFVSYDPLKVSQITFKNARDYTSNSSYGSYPTQYPQYCIEVEASNDASTWVSMGQIKPKLWTQLAETTIDVDNTNAYMYWRFKSVDRINNYFTVQHIAFTAQYEKEEEDGTKVWATWTQPNFTSASQDNCKIYVSGTTGSNYAYYAFNTSTSYNNCWKSNEISSSSRYWDTSNIFTSHTVTTAYLVGCNKITGYDCRYWRVNYVVFDNTDSFTSFSGSFYSSSSGYPNDLIGCIIPNTENVTNWNNAFRGCSNMTVAPQIKITSKVTSVDRMFTGTKLVDFTHLDLSEARELHGLLRDIDSGYTDLNLELPEARTLSCFCYNTSSVKRVNIVAPKARTLNLTFAYTENLEYVRITGSNSNETVLNRWSRPTLTSNTSSGSLTKDSSLSIIDSGSDLYFMYDNYWNYTTLGSSSHHVRFSGTGSIYWTLPEDTKLKIKTIYLRSGYSTAADGGFTGRFYADAEKTIPLTDEFSTDGSVWRKFEIPVTADETVRASAIVLDIINNPNGYASIGEITFDAESEVSGYLTDMTGAFYDSSVAYVNIDSSKVTTMEKAFYNEYTTTSSPTSATAKPRLLDIPDISYDSVIELSYAFRGQTRLTELNNVEFPAVQSANYAFQYCRGLIDVSGLSMPECTQMNYTFQYCDSLGVVSKPNWPKASALAYAFADCNYLKDADLSTLIAATDLNHVCYGDSSLAKVKVPTVTNLSYAFAECYLLRQATLGDTTQITDMSYAFQNCSTLVSVSDLALNACTNFAYAFDGCYWLETVPLSNLDSATDMSYAFRNCAKLTSVSVPAISNVTTLAYAFYNCTNLVSLSIGTMPKCTSLAYLCYNCTALTDVTFTDSSAVESFEQAFNYCTSLETITLPDTSKGQSFYGTFDHCYKLKNIGAMDMSSATSCSEIFRFCYVLQSSPISSITSKCTNIKSMYEYCQAITDWSFLENFDVSNVTNTEYMFRGCRFSSMSITNWKWNSSVTTSYMLDNNPNLTTVTLDFSNMNGIQSSFGYSSYPHQYMFQECPNLTTLNIIGGSKLGNMNRLFAGCALKEITFDMSKFTTSGWWAQECFYNCANLESVIWNVANRSFDSIGQSSTNYSPFYRIFAHCPKLKSISISNAQNIKNWYRAFTDMDNTELCTIDWNDTTFDNLYTYNMFYAQYGATGPIKHINLNAHEDNPGYYAFNSSTSNYYCAEPMYQEAQLDLDLPVDIQVTNLSFTQKSDATGNYDCPDKARFYSDSECTNPITPELILEEVASSEATIEVANVVTDHITCKFGKDLGRYIGCGYINIEGKVKAEVSSTALDSIVLSSNGTLGGDSFACACSSYESGYPAYQAFDGSTSTYWGPSSSSTPQTLTFYSPTTMSISSISLVYRDSSEIYSAGTIYISDDNSTWTSVQSWSGNSSTSQTFSFASALKCKYVQFKFTSRYGSGWGKVRVNFVGSINDLSYLPWSTSEGTWTVYEDWEQPVLSASSETVIANNFSTDNWIQYPSVFNPSGTWEMQWKINTSSDVTTEQGFAGVKSIWSFVLEVNSGTLGYWFSSNGTSWNVASQVLGSYAIEANKEYYIKLAWDGTNTTCSVSEDGSTWTVDYTTANKLYFSDETYLYLSGMHSSTSSPWLGSIDLMQCYVKSGDETFWSYADNSVNTVGSVVITDYRDAGTAFASSELADNEAYEAVSSIGWAPETTDAAPYWQWNLPITVRTSAITFNSNAMETCRLYSDDGITVIGDSKEPQLRIIANNFSESSYVSVNSQELMPFDSYIEWFVKFYTTTPSTYGQILIWNNKDNGLYIGNDSHIATWVESAQHSGSTTLLANTWYWARFRAAGTSVEVYLLKDADQMYTINTVPPSLSAWSKEISHATSSSVSTLFGSQIYACGAKDAAIANGEYLQGAIDLSNTRMYTNWKNSGDAPWWDPSDSSNYTVAGDVTISNVNSFALDLSYLTSAVASDFSSSNYLAIKKIPDSFSSFVIEMKFTTGELSDSTYQVMYGNAYTNKTCPRCDIKADKLLWAGFPISVSDDWAYIDGPEVSANTTYWIRQSWDESTATGTLEYSTDGVSYTTAGTVSVSSINWTGAMSIGADQESKPFYGSIDLLNTKIYIDNVLWWSYTNSNSATVIGSPTIITDSEGYQDLSIIRIKPLTLLDSEVSATYISDLKIIGTYAVEKSNIYDFSMPDLTAYSQGGYTVTCTPAKKTLYYNSSYSYIHDYMMNHAQKKEQYVPAFFSNFARIQYPFAMTDGATADSSVAQVIHDLDFHSTAYDTTSAGYVGSNWFYRNNNNNAPSVITNPKNICNSITLSSLTLTHDTLVAILNALMSRVGTTACTLTIGSTNLAQLSDEEKAIATEKNWNLA